MAKRTATRELNHDNWDDEEEDDDAGSWKPAPAEAIQGRVIKQARRKLAGNSGEAKAKAFSSFPQLPTTETAEKENGNGNHTPTDTGAANNEKEYLASLKVLNETVSSWIADHVKKNPCCLLTPIFQDYEKHLKELESKRNASSSSKEPSEKIIATNTDTETKKLFQFGASQAEPAKPSLNFFSPSSTLSTPTSSTFSFKGGSSSTTTTTASSTDPAPFSFGTSKPSFGTAAPFSFGLSSKPLAAVEEKKEEAEEEGDDEDTPPKVEVKPVQEEDAFYSIKCKLFYKKDNNFVEKGVGTLHLKKAKEDKTQLVVRADTSLGNILLNILLNPQLTPKRVGKNNVMLVCIPNPPIDPKTPPTPTPMLLRVKTDVEADELLAKLNDAKK